MGSVASKSSPYSAFTSFVEYEQIVHLLNCGDLIEIQRGNYKHWAIFERVDEIGAVWCWHVSGTGHRDDGSGKEVAFSGAGKAVIKYEPLWDILRDNPSGIASRCRVNNQEAMARKMLNTTKNSMPDINLVFVELHKRKDRPVHYDLKSRNCEHFATFCKYGIGWSTQVNSYKEIIVTALKMMETFGKSGSEMFNKNGYYKCGSVCLIVAVVCQVAAVIVERISLTLDSISFNDFVKHGIAY